MNENQFTSTVHALSGPGASTAIISFSIFPRAILPEAWRIRDLATLLLHNAL
jgi:hypothetical protein